MNHVNLIGKVCSDPQELEEGAYMIAVETRLITSAIDRTIEIKERHQVKIVGRFARTQTISLIKEGIDIAIEGRLAHHNGSEYSVIIEVNDLIIL